MTIFDQMHLTAFDRFYGLDDEAIREIAQRFDIPFEDLKQRINSPGVGVVYGHAHTTTVVPLLERLFYGQRCKSVTLKIDLENADDPDVCDGHLSIEVAALERMPL